MKPGIAGFYPRMICFLKIDHYLDDSSLKMVNQFLHIASYYSVVRQAAATISATTTTTIRFRGL